MARLDGQPAESRAEPLLALRGVGKQYPSGRNVVSALTDVTLTVAAGEFVSIVGPSGSGKSTLMNILGLLDRPTSGAYQLAGRPMERMGARQLAAERNERIGFVFQSFYLLPHLRLVDNVAAPLLYFGMAPGRRVERAMAALRLVGIDHLAQRRPTQVSGGQQQRAAIARALVTHPRLILADEPTGNLDTRTSREIMDVFRTLNTEGLTIVQVTHEPGIARYGHRIVAMRDGRVESVASQAEWQSTLDEKDGWSV